MKLNVGIIQYKKGSKSAKLLQKELKNIWKLGNVYRVKPLKTPIRINWGSSNVKKVEKNSPLLILNHPKNTIKATNKIMAFNHFKENCISIPPFTTNIEEAKQWIENGWKLVARLNPASYHGVGIKVLRTPEEFVEAPLYTRYFPRRKEYRVIVVGGKGVKFMRKILDPQYENEGHSEIRNGDRYIYSTIPENANQTLEALNTLAISAIKALNLDFGAVDVIYNIQNRTYYVLEVNTAFGLGEQNSPLVAQAIKELIFDKLKEI